MDQLLECHKDKLLKRLSSLEHFGCQTLTAHEWAGKRAKVAWGVGEAAGWIPHSVDSFQNRRGHDATSRQFYGIQDDVVGFAATILFFE
jgi:hypothetical protein